MPWVASVFIFIVLSIGFSFIPLTVAIASPVSIPFMGAVGSYFLSWALAKIYRELNVAQLQ
jgi:hypothetical protein